MSGFEDDPTPPKGRHRPLTDSEREVFRIKYESGVPSVGEYDHDDTSPIDLFRREPKRSQGLVTELRRHPDKVIPFLGEFAEWVHSKFREQSSSEQSAVAELRELLNKPPNGATKRLQEQVEGLMTAVSELVERAEDAERRAEKAEERLASVEGTIKSAKGMGWKAISAVVVTIAGSAVAIITSWQSNAEKAGAAAERSANDRLRIDRLERLSDDRPRTPRRDYDYDITPRPFVPPKKEP